MADQFEVAGTNICQRLSDDPDVEEKKRPPVQSLHEVAQAGTRAISDSKPKKTLSWTAAIAENIKHSEAALSPQEDMK